jgi:Zn-dependent peptidase ImmA (M78 family)
MLYVPKRNPYQHPGRLFIAEYGLPILIDDIYAYARFLRQHSMSVPVRLRAIKWRFGIRREFIREKDLLDTDGFNDHQQGIIWVNQHHSEERQRFTFAHELMEMLFCACEESPEREISVFAIMSDQKERLCNKGAAALLIPRRSLLTHLSGTRPSLQLASNLVKEYRISLTACVHRMVEVSPEPCTMIIWHVPPNEVRIHAARSLRSRRIILS